MTDVHSARVEAATNAMVDSEAYYCALHMRPDELRKDARDVLAAADAVVTVEMIRDELVSDLNYASNPRTGGWELNIDKAAQAIHRLYTGKEQEA